MGAYNLAKGWEEKLDNFKSYLEKAAKKIMKFANCMHPPRLYKEGYMVLVNFN